MANPKSKTHYFFYKSLILIFVLIIFTYFPSQLPDIYKKDLILSKLWELIYLLVIGIVVCYGLFSRKIDSSRSDNDNTIDGNGTYLSGISNISSIFEDSESQYCLREDEKYLFEHLGKRETVKVNISKLCVKDVSSGWDEIKKGKFRGLVPIKLENKFKESETDSDSQSDLMNARSESMRLGDESSSHFKTGFDFDDLKSKSMRYSMSSSNEIMNDFGKKNKVEDVKLNCNDNVVFVKSKSQRYASATESSEMNVKAAIANTYKRGKSVRTKRLKEQVVEVNVETCKNQTDDKVETRSSGMNVKSDELSNFGVVDRKADELSDSGEVDRKADEFIAKFKEQIRLQKAVSSTTKSILITQVS